MKVRRFLFIFLLAVAALTGLFAYKTLDFLKAIGVKSKSEKSSFTLFKKPPASYTGVLLGYGGGTHEGGYLTDTIIIGHINFETKRALLISLPRDLWVKLPTRSGDTFATKINNVYQLQLYPATYPDVNVKRYTNTDPNGLLKHVLKEITGMSIDSVVAVDFRAYRDVIDLLGGIDIQIDKSFTDTEYPVEGKEADLCGRDEDFQKVEKFLKPGYEGEEKEKLFEEKPELETFLAQIEDDPTKAFPCRYQTVSFSEGMTHLSGEDALKYARSRHAPEDGGDFARARRQQKVIEAVRNRVLNPLFLPKVPSLMDTVKDEIETDASYEDIQRFLKETPNANKYRLIKIVLSDQNFLKSDTSDDGQFILIPKGGEFKWNEIHKAFKRVSEGLPLSPTPAPAKKTKTM